jgi:hypothetical protein
MAHMKSRALRYNIKKHGDRVGNLTNRVAYDNLSTLEHLTNLGNACKSKQLSAIMAVFINNLAKA